MRLASAGAFLTSAGAVRGRFGELDQLDVEHQRAFRTPLLSLVGERLGNPEPTFFAGHHELHAFGPSGDDAVERKRHLFARRDRAVEHLAVGRPTGVVDGDEIRFVRMCGARAGRDHLGRETRRRLRRVGRRRGDVRGRRKDLERSRLGGCERGDEHECQGYRFGHPEFLSKGIVHSRRQRASMPRRDSAPNPDRRSGRSSSQNG